MRTVNYSQIEALHAAARRERSHYVYCLLVRFQQWLATRAARHSGPCCQPA